MKRIKIVIEEHTDGFVAYPLGLKGVVVGQGDSYEQALADVRSAVEFHVETFGDEAFESGLEVIQAYLTDSELAG